MKLTDYINGNRRGTEANRFEREAMTDPFLHEAFEGYDAAGGSHAETLNRLRQAVRKRTESRSRLRAVWWSAAAVAVLGIITASLYLVLPIQKDKWQLADAKMTHPAPDTAMPPAVEAELFVEMQEEEPPQAEFSDIKKFTPPVVIAEEEDVSEAPASTEVKRAKLVVEDKIVYDQKQLNVIAEAVVQADPILDRTKSISGRVTDEKGMPLAGVTIISDDKGVVTDGEGHFRFEQPPASGRLSIAHIGYEQKQISVSADSSPMLISMKEASLAFEDVVAIGYGTSKRSDVTGSVATVAAATKTQPASPTPLDEARTRFDRYVSDNLVRQKDETGEPITGAVAVSFKVNTKGRPYAIVIGESLSPSADREARRLVRNGPDWPPSDDPISVTIRF